MHLQHLELHGFKTFANKTEFIFHRGVTAIVGPNGSGKSNIADAIRWAMGEQSYTALRVKKTEDIIFAGSSLRPRMGMTEVALTLENPLALASPEAQTLTDEPLPEPEASDADGKHASRVDVVTEILRANPSEVTITRRAYRSGENEYLINRQRVRLRDIAELLARWGLARNTYAVVGQGLIDTALSLRPEERRALFEEAAGIALYQSKKENALEKLVETQQNLLRANDILNEIAPRLPSLARQADRAKNYQGVADALDAKLKQWYAFQWARTHETFRDAAWHEKEAREQLDAHRTEVQSFATRLHQARREMQELRTRSTEARRRISARENEYSARLRDLAVLQERARFMNRQKEETDAELATQRENVRIQQENLERAGAVFHAREDDRARAIARLRLSQARVGEMEQLRETAQAAEQQSAQRDLAERLTTIKNLLPYIEEGLRAIAALIAQIESAHHARIEQEARTRAVEQARADVVEARTNLTLAEREVTTARANIETAQGSLTQAENQLTAREKRTAAFDVEFAALNAEHAARQAEVDALKIELATFEGENAPVEAELAAHEKLQGDLEEQEAFARARLGEYEDAYNRAVLAAERARAEIARLETEIEDDLGPVELDSDLPRQLRLRLTTSRGNGEEGEGESAQIVVLPQVTAVPEGLEKEIRKLKNQMRYIGSVNPQAPQEYTELKQRHDFLKAQSEDLNRAITQLHAAIAELDEIMKRKFAETFDAVNVEFQKFFTLLFGGGTARLELTNPEDLTATGIDIVAKPPGKRAVHLAMLSGGERSLTAQALLFAILKVSPTPFCVLDEVDAMLDEANVGRFRDALRSLSGGTQFIVITHNRATIESADTLYGVSMGDDGVSQVISLRLAGVEKKLRQPARATPD
jgi:chromosome segregation ATPase